MRNFDWGAFAAACETAEVQFRTNAPLPPATANEGGIVAALTAAQPVVAKLSTFVTTKPGAITAALTVLASLKAQGIEWAGELEDILSTAASALPSASADLSTAIRVLKEFAPAPTWAPSFERGEGRGPS